MTNRKKISSPVASSTLLVVGVVAIVFSLYQNSSVAVFVGLGLILWGIVLRYVTTQEYVKKEMLSSQTISTYTNIDRILKEFGTAQKAIYLPAKYLSKMENNIAYLTRNISDKLPSPERLLLEEKLGMDPEKGKLIVPPGHGLTRQLEKALHTSFTQVDLKFLIQNLPKLVTEDLEIASDLTMDTRDSTVQVKFSNSIFDSKGEDEEESSKTISLLGCPMASAIACAIAKASGRPTIISNYAKEQRTAEVTYQLLDESANL